MRPRLIPEWKRALRMWSVRFGLAAAAWLATPEDKQLQALALLPWSMTPDQMAGLLVVLTLVGRLIAQPKVRT